MLRAFGYCGCYTWSCKHVGVAEVIAAVLQGFSHAHILCYTELWDAEIGPAAAGPAGPAGPTPTALNYIVIQFQYLYLDIWAQPFITFPYRW